MSRGRATRPRHFANDCAKGIVGFVATGYATGMMLRLRAKLRLASLGVIAIVATLEIIGLYSIGRLRDSTDRVARSLSRIDQVQGLRISLERLLMPAHDFLVHGGIKEAALFKEYGTELSKRIEAARAEYAASELDEAARRLEFVQNHATTIFHLTEPVGHPIGSALMERMDEEAHLISTELDRILGVAREQAAEEIEAAARVKERMWTVMIVGGVLALLLAGAWIFPFAGRLTQRLYNLHDAVKAVSDGDLDTQLQPDGRDELGAIGAAFNQMKRDLSVARRRLVAAERLAAIGEITVTVKHEMNNPIQGILSATELLQMAPDDSALVARTSEKIRETTVRLRDIVERATHIDDDQASDYIQDIKMIRLPEKAPDTSSHE